MKKQILIGVICFAVGLLLGVGVAYKMLNKEPHEVVFQLKDTVDSTA